MSVFKSKERSEDSYIGLGDFFVFFFRKKILRCSNYYRYAFIHVNECTCIYALFKSNELRSWW